MKGILIAGTETEAETHTDGGVAAEAGAFLRGPDQLFAQPDTEPARAVDVTSPVRA